MMPEIGLLVLRVMIGAVFMAHGAQKLFGWFGGPGLTKYASGLEERSHVYPGWFWAWVLGPVVAVPRMARLRARGRDPIL